MAVAWMLLGTVGGEIQLLRRIAAPLIRRSGLSGSCLNDEFEGIAVAPDVAVVVMPTDHQRRRIGKTGEQFSPCHRRLAWVGISRRRPVEMRHLAGLTADVTADQALFSHRPHQLPPMSPPLP